jgi:tripartite-type tricarboxylate transporter receptor subunit TctC
MSIGVCVAQHRIVWRYGLVAGLLVVGLVLNISPCTAQQQSYPAGPVRFIVGAPPGGPIDVAARLLAQYLPGILNQPGIVENKPGAGGIVATRTVVAAAPDGLTVLSAANSLLATEKANPEAGYHVERDLVPVFSIGWTPNVIVAAPGLAILSLNELIEYARQHDLNYGTLGSGTTTHLMTEYLLRNVAHVKVQHVAYAGSAPALQAIAGDQLDMATVAMIAAVPLIQAHQIKALAVTSGRRVASLPDVPTLAEAGYPGNDYVTWVGFFMPARTPAEISSSFAQAALKALAMKEVRDKLVALGFEVETSWGDQLKQQVSAELDHWGEVVAKTGIKVE